jgi:hypothetical protein
MLSTVVMVDCGRRRRAVVVMVVVMVVMIGGECEWRRGHLSDTQQSEKTDLIYTLLYHSSQAVKSVSQSVGQSVNQSSQSKSPKEKDGTTL